MSERMRGMGLDRNSTLNKPYQHQLIRKGIYTQAYWKQRKKLNAKMESERK